MPASTPKPKMGRPAVVKGVGQVHVWMDAEMFAWVQDRARRQGRPIAHVVRALVRRGMK